MRYFTLLFLIMLFAQFSSFGQDCPDDIFVNSQEDLENLMAQYPNCAHVSGNVQLRNFTDLSPLSGIITIGGELSVTTNYPLSNFSGLESLEAIGSLRLYNLENISSLAGLESVHLVLGDLRIQQLPNLGSLAGLSGLTDVGGKVQIWSNDALTSLTGLENLENVGGSFSLQYNDGLTSIEEASSLQFIGDYLEIINNDAIQIISGFNALHTISGYFHFYDNLNLIAAYGFENLTKVGDVRMRIKSETSEIACLDNVREMGSLDIDQNCQVLRLENLMKVNGDFRIDATDMHSLIGCNQLDTVGGSMILSTAMKNLPDFPQLKIIGGMLLIDSRDHLEVLDGFDRLETIGIGQLGWGFDVYNHAQLTEMSGFNQLEQVAGNFVISDCAALESITGFQNLFHVQGNFSLSYNPSLNDCSAFCSFLLNRDESLSTFVWQNGDGMDYPCWETDQLLEACSNRPILVKDVDLNFTFGIRKRPLELALIELTYEDTLVQSVFTEADGTGDISFNDLEEGKIYQLDVSFPETNDELLVRHRVSKDDLLNGFEVEFPLSLRRKIDTTSNALDSLLLQVQIYGANAYTKQIEGYQITSFLEFLNDWSLISEDHDQIIESMYRVALGVHYIHEYYHASKPFTTKFTKVSYDMVVNMLALVSIYNSTNGLKDKLTGFIESEVDKGNIELDGIYARAQKELMLSILNQGFAIMKSTLLDPYMNSFSNSPHEQQFVGMMKQFIFIIENHLLKADSELIKASLTELLVQWFSDKFIQYYYIDYATQDYVEITVDEGLQNQGNFEDIFQQAKMKSAASAMTNESATFAADLFEGNAMAIAGVGEVLENLSIAITLSSATTLAPVAGPMMTVANGFKGLAAVLNGANFLNYGERIVFLPVELGGIVTNLSTRNGASVEAYPDGYLESLTTTLSASLDTLVTYQESLAGDLEAQPLSFVSSAYLELHAYYQDVFLPRYTVMKDIATHIATASDTSLRNALITYAGSIHQFEMQYLALQLQLTAIHLDSTEISYRDSAIVTISEWAGMHHNLVNLFDTIYANGASQSFGPFVSVRSITVPDTFVDQIFNMTVTLENVGPVTTPPFQVSLTPNQNTTTYKLVNGEEQTGAYAGLELSLAEQVTLPFSVHVTDPDSAITLLVDIEGVEGNDLSVPIEFLRFDQLVHTDNGNEDQIIDPIQLFPNPTKDGFTIQHPSDLRIREIKIYQPDGHLIYQHKWTDQTIPTNGWLPGMYYVEILLDHRSITKKILVE